MTAPAAARARRPSAVSARSVAAEVLVRASRDGAFAAAALDAALGREIALDARDRGLATELVYGVLRTRPLLEARLARYLTKPLDALPEEVLAHLLVAAYQLLFLDRVPPFAAVDEAVGRIAARFGPRGLSGVANAVLRKVAAEGRLPAEERPAVVAAAAPAWLVDALTNTLGAAGASAFLADTLAPPPTGLRLTPRADAAAVLEALRAVTAAARPAPHAPRAILVDHAGDPSRLPGVGVDFVVQEEGSQLLAHALGVQPGERVLDACAGRGHKTAILVAAAGSDGAVYAADLHPKKLDRLARAVAAEVGLPVAGTFAVDASVGTGAIPGDLDAVLVDAPCSGIGTLRRRPDLLLRRDPARLEELTALQGAILAQAATRLRAGGRLVFATCSVLREEGEGVVDRFLASPAGAAFARAPFADPAAAALATAAGDPTTLRLLPTVHGTDGYVAVSLRRR